MFIAISAYIKRTERSQINDIMLHLKLLEKHKTSRRREIIKRRAENNEIQSKSPYKKQ
jgi:hypothetical protein